MRKYAMVWMCLTWVLASCAPIANSPTIASPTDTQVAETPLPSTLTFTPVLPSATFSPSATATFTPIPTVASLKATVTADLLSCRYGPGADYLYLFALRKTANIKLVGRVDGNNWKWALVENSPTRCWVNAEYLDIAGDPLSLPIVYPGIAKLPQSPYYPPTVVTKIARAGTQIKMMWLEVPLHPGDEEDTSMEHYIVETWHCVGGQLIFEPLATNDTSITIPDEPGCSQPSHGRIFVQEKHGFAGPAEIPWPPYTPMETPTP
jgi:hypothetical protein